MCPCKYSVNHYIFSFYLLYYHDRHGLEYIHCPRSLGDVSCTVWQCLVDGSHILPSIHNWISLALTYFVTTMYRNSIVRLGASRLRLGKGETHYSPHAEVLELEMTHVCDEERRDTRALILVVLKLRSLHCLVKKCREWGEFRETSKDATDWFI
jgi:hypothetical protein